MKWKGFDVFDFIGKIFFYIFALFLFIVLIPFLILDFFVALKNYIIHREFKGLLVIGYTDEELWE